MLGNKKYNTKEDIKRLVEQLLSGKYDPEDFSYEFPSDLMHMENQDLFGDDQGDVYDACGMFDTDIDPNDPNMVGMYDPPAFLKFFQEMYDKYLKD